MKATKKLTAVLLALVMVLTLAACGGGGGGGILPGERRDNCPAGWGRAANPGVSFRRGRHDRTYRNRI